MTENLEPTNKQIYNLAIALIDMLEQHAPSGKEGELFDDGLSANENAISELYKLGIVEIKNGRIFINFKKLESYAK